MKDDVPKQSPPSQPHVETLQGMSHTPSPIHPAVRDCDDGGGGGGGGGDDDRFSFKTASATLIVIHTFVAPVRTLRRSPGKVHLLTSAGSIKIVRINILSEHHVVIQVQKFAADAWNTMQMRLNGRGGEGGEVRLIRENGFVCDDAVERGGGRRGVVSTKRRTIITGSRLT
jgi:hypothetical protein